MFISKGKLKILELGPLDLATADGKAFYERYFGDNTESRPIVVSDHTAEQLEELGYVLPNWKVPRDKSTSGENSGVTDNDDAPDQTGKPDSLQPVDSQDQQQATMLSSIWVAGSLMLLALIVALARRRNHR